ncbi:3-carboxy-cis,cis-muconate cycloisomerase [Uliginosibacterium sp. sgz301328]|uniref:3-carboxy-cis,cis-muconate cycloisomerase n=1 Tax=Uliginosibacterium sp. sgz301328 TaxID=3243764 RepID=UPI00359DB82F
MAADPNDRESAGSAILAAMFGTREMEAIFSDAGWIGRMLRFEAALARAEAIEAVIPASAVAAIEAQCATLPDIATLASAAALAGNPAIPLVKDLTRRVAAVDEPASRYVHWGATSQDAMDTAQVLQLRDALAVLDGQLSTLCTACVALAQAHRNTPMIGRTWLQQALPTTFGVKAAGWLSALVRHRQRLLHVRRNALVLQFGGAAGTLASLGDRGVAVARALGRQLDLPVPDMPWHAHRDRIVEVGAAAGLIVGTLGKIARDVSLMMQTEVGEAFEPAAPGKGGSSTMPHKRNPVGCAVALQAATRAPMLVASLFAGMVQEHERGLGGWQAEWTTLPELMRMTSGAAAHMAEVLQGLEVDTGRMRANLDITCGTVMSEAVAMALGDALGRQVAHELVEHASRQALAEHRPLREVLAGVDAIRAHLSPQRLDELCDPRRYIGVATSFIDEALAQARAVEEQIKE